MPRPPDSLLTSDTFKARLGEADRYAKKNDLDRWATRIAWVGLVFNTLVARRFAQRRAGYQTSRAWRCYSNLVDAGILSEDPEGIIYQPSPLYEEGNGPLLWFDTLVRIADGMAVPEGFLCLRRQDEEVGNVIPIRIINGG